METIYSDFWFDESFDDGEIHLIKLANFKKSISNFVQILTNKNIPVRFSSSDLSFTDGQSIEISSEIKNKKDFDVTVGLALHEGSHILLSDFTILKTIWQRTPRHLYDLAKKLDISKETINIFLKTVFNYVEDRYIDQFIYKNAPGYRGYYKSLYNKYFNNIKIGDVLKSEVYREPTIDAYLYRLINLTNKDTDLNALPDLDKIYKELDLKNILRLKNCNDRFKLSITISEIILNNIINNNSNTLKDDKTPSDSTDSTDSDDLLGGNQPFIGVVEEDDDIKEDVVSGMGNTDGLTENNIKKIKSDLNRYKDFLDGNFKKKRLNKEDSEKIEVIENSGISLVKVAKDLDESNSYKGITCIVVDKLTKELIMSRNFPLSRNIVKFDEPDFNLDRSISKGVSLGKILGKKLQLRSDINVTKFMRKCSGKLDKRIISELGIGNENIFYSDQIDKYNDSYLHISVDASSSMNGDKWNRTMTSVVAICKAASMIQNIRVSVSFRTTLLESYKNQHIPYIVMAYDSNIDKFSKITSLFKYLHPNNITPEGLTYEAIIKRLPKNNFDKDFYFINFSDGLPFFKRNDNGIKILYSDKSASLHTKKQVDNIKNNGYKILSYFIKSELTQEIVSIDNFKLMYGKDASFIDVNNITKIAKTMNDMFLKKKY